MVDDARTYDFLETGQTDLVYAPLAPDRNLTPEDVAQIAAARDAFLREQQRNADAALRERNETYRSERGVSDRDAIEFNNYIARTFAHKWASTTDWGLLPVAAKILTVAVSTAATGGLAAPSVAVLWNDVKKVAKIPSTVSGAKNQLATIGEWQAQYEDTMQDVQRAFRPPDRAEDVPAQQAAADVILSHPDGPAIVADTLKLANAGDVDAQRGAILLARAAAARKEGGIAPGQSLFPRLPPEEASEVAAVLQTTLQPARVDARPGWWHRLLQFLHLEAQP